MSDAVPSHAAAEEYARHYRVFAESTRRMRIVQWKGIVREGLSVIDQAPENLHRFVQGLRTLKGMNMTDQRLREAWKLFPTIGDSIKGQIVSRYVEHEEPTLFGLFNAGTNVFWHREKMTAADYAHNDAFTTGLMKYAFDHLN